MASGVFDLWLPKSQSGELYSIVLPGRVVMLSDRAQRAYRCRTARVLRLADGQDVGTAMTNGGLYILEKIDCDCPHSADLHVELHRDWFTPVSNSILARASRARKKATAQ